MNLPCISNNTPAPQASCISFSSIEQNSRAEFCLESDVEYLAEFLRQNPTVCYWNVDSVNQCIEALPIPEWQGSVETVTTDAEVLDAMQNGVSGTCYDGQGGTYTLPVSNQFGIQGAMYKNMTLVPSAPASTNFINIAATDISFLNVVADLLDGPYQSGIQVNRDRFSFVKSAVKNIRQTGTPTTRGIRINSGDNYIVGSRFENLISVNGAAIRGIHWPDVDVNGSIIANNYFENIQETITAQFDQGDADSMVAQNGTFFTPTLILANRGVNFGKRLVKIQQGNMVVLSNWGHWRDAQSPDGYRKKSSLVAHQIGSDVTIRNNYLISDYDTQFEQTQGYILSTGFGNVTEDNIHLDCNIYEVNHSGSVGSDYGIMMLNWTSHTPPYPTNSSMLDNVIIGSGQLDYIYWDRDTGGSDDFALFTDSNLGTATVPFAIAFTRNS